MKINQRIKLIRTTEGFTQLEFAKLIGVVNDRVVRKIESGGQEPGVSKVERICQRFPEYSLWLITGQVQPPNQISPDLAKANKDVADASVKSKTTIKG
jgi:transcriptional regulator with XRE-family HTH domain